jgi:hypothetical protein
MTARKVVQDAPAANTGPATEWLSFAEMLDIGRRLRPDVPEKFLRITLLIEAEFERKRKHRPDIHPPITPIAITSHSRLWLRSGAEDLFRGIQLPAYVLPPEPPKQSHAEKAPLTKAFCEKHLRELEKAGKIKPNASTPTRAQALIDEVNFRWSRSHIEEILRGRQRGK